MDEILGLVQPQGPYFCNIRIVWTIIFAICYAILICIRYPLYHNHNLLSIVLSGVVMGIHHCNLVCHLDHYLFQQFRNHKTLDLFLTNHVGQASSESSTPSLSESASQFSLQFLFAIATFIATNKLTPPQMFTLSTCNKRIKDTTVS